MEDSPCPAKWSGPRQEEQLVEKGLKAFGEAAVYFGGPYDLNNPGQRASTACTDIAYGR